MSFALHVLVDSGLGCEMTGSSSILADSFALKLNSLSSITILIGTYDFFAVDRLAVERFSGDPLVGLFSVECKVRSGNLRSAT